ncbi:MAG TPA: MBL fold metallo-hydrolase [Abditibacteriaceae bacterium]|nr:MBL fold metallo-hydrolase [Abditibacteriaceae bacterium]
MSLHIAAFVVGPLPNNLYLLVDEAAREAVLIDPSIDGAAALEHMRRLQREGFMLSAIWLTHGHFDHVYDTAIWRDEFGVPILMHRADEFWLQRLREQSLWMGLPAPRPVAPDRWIEDGEMLNIGAHRARVLHTPGHSPGSVSFLFEEQGVCVAGDVLFRGSVGRTDLPGCSPGQLQESLHQLCSLPDATRVLPGHGEATTIGFEKATNPFCQSVATKISDL